MTTLTQLVRETASLPIVVQALDIWSKGGWAMYALLFNGVLIFGIGTHMMLKLWAKGFFVSPDRAWRSYWRNAGVAGCSAGRVVARAMKCATVEETEHFFDALRNAELYPFERDLPMMKVAVSAAPLLGLLGTVTGMLATFGALATGGGGEKTMNMVAGGISEALVTTETGLLLALTGLIFQSILTRQHEKYGKALAHIETLCLQHFRRGYSGKVAPPAGEVAPRPILALPLRRAA